MKPLAGLLNTNSAAGKNAKDAVSGIPRGSDSADRRRLAKRETGSVHRQADANAVPAEMKSQGNGSPKKCPGRRRGYAELEQVKSLRMNAKPLKRRKQTTGIGLFNTLPPSPALGTAQSGGSRQARLLVGIGEGPSVTYHLPTRPLVPLRSDEQGVKWPGWI